MNRVLIVEASKCTGCRLCEAVCSATKNGTVNPARARIGVVHWETQCADTPMICQQCERAACAAVCPVKALVRDQSGEKWTIDDNLCLGCRFCVAACPFGAMSFDSATRKVVKCDHCDGDPVCVQFCEPRALQFIDATLAARTRMREAARKVSELMGKPGA